MAGETKIKSNPGRYITSTGLTYLDAYTDIWVKEVLEEWTIRYGRVSSSGSMGLTASATISLEQARNLINNTLDKIIAMAATQIRIDPRFRAPTEENLPYRIIRSSKSKGSTTLADFISALGSGYYGKDIKLISLMPGSADISNIASGLYTPSASPVSYSSPFSSLTPDQAKTAALDILNKLQTDPKFTSYFSSNPVPVGSAPPRQTIDALLKFAQKGPDESKAVFGLMFPRIIP